MEAIEKFGAGDNSDGEGSGGLMRRVGVYSPTVARGGSEEYLIALARSLRSRGVGVFVALPDAEGVRSVREDLAASGIELDSFPFSSEWPSASDYLRTRSHVLAQLRREAPDGLFLILPAVHTGAAVIDAAAHCGVPLAVIFQLVGYVHPFTSAERRLYTWARRQRQCWATVSSANRDLLCEGLSWGGDAIEVVHNGVHPPPHTDATARAHAHAVVRRELGLPDDTVLALTAARLHEQKAYDVTLEAAARVVARHPNAHCLWLGAGELETELREAIRLRGLDGHVHMLGHRTDVHTFMLGSDIFVLPSRYEGLPFALLEALHAGLPVVCSDIPPHREVFGHDESAAVLVAVQDHAALAAALERLIAAPALRASMGLAAREHAKRFSWDASFHRAVDVLARAGDHPTRPGWPLCEGPIQRRIAIYGAGEGGRRAFVNALLPGEEVVTFLDRDRGGRGEEMYGRPVLAPSAALTLDLDKVVVASLHYTAISETLIAMGFPEERIEYVDLMRLIDTSRSESPGV